MPYAIAHPVAVIPLARALGARAVPSALAIGSMAPDVWYFVPLATRGDSHSLLGFSWICMPAALLGYLAFHLLFKQPLLALAPPALAARLASFTPRGLPQAGAAAVLYSLALGIATHLIWDVFTHDGRFARALTLLRAPVFAIGDYSVQLHQVLQHASTLGASLFLAWWIWRKLAFARSDPAPWVPTLPTRVRQLTWALLAVIPAVVCVWMLLELPWSYGTALEALRKGIRAAGITSLSAFGFTLLAVCLAMRRLAPANEPVAQAPRFRAADDPRFGLRRATEAGNPGD